jgi:hypothetical protein
MWANSIIEDAVNIGLDDTRRKLLNRDNVLDNVARVARNTCSTFVNLALMRRRLECSLEPTRHFQQQQKRATVLVNT